jgi:hypothetical protein
MGVFHLSGLGLNPGAVTVPLTYIYFLLKQSKEGDPKSKEFFIHSGEESEKLRGKPEALILFTSKEVIKGEQRDITDRFFRTKKRKNACKTIMNYISNVIKSLKLQGDTFGDYGIRYLYAVEVNFKNFEDCYKKIYLTMRALQDKEIECNLIGGSNQINLSLMLAGSMTGVVGRLYYVFETDNKIMHPSSIKNITQRIKVPPENWYEIPPLFVSMGDVIRRLESLGIIEKAINIAQIKNVLEEIGLPKQFISKLRGTWIVIRDDRAEAGPFLQKVLELHRELEKVARSIGNFTKWTNYFEERGLLYKFVENGKEC